MTSRHLLRASLLAAICVASSASAQAAPRYHGTNFLIGRTVGEVFNPVGGGPDRVVNIESSARTKYDALLVSADRQFSGGHNVRVAYTLAKAFNYANDDQIPFLNGPIDPSDLGREFGPTPNDPNDPVQRGRSSIPHGARAQRVHHARQRHPVASMVCRCRS